MFFDPFLVVSEKNRRFCPYAGKYGPENPFAGTFYAVIVAKREVELNMVCDKAP